MIVLTAEQAAQVRGETSEGAALDPILLSDGATFVLPVEVLADAAHQSRRAFLSSLPTREIAPEEWVTSDD